MADVSLKPCPFCGGEAVLHDECYPDYVQCTQCGAEVRGVCFGLDAADVKWNRRTESIKIVNNGTLVLTRGRII